MTHIFDVLLAQAELEPVEVTVTPLELRICADGFVPTSRPFVVQLDEMAFWGQRAEHPTTDDVRVYWSPFDDPAAIGFAIRRSGGV